MARKDQRRSLRKWYNVMKRILGPIIQHELKKDRLKTEKVPQPTDDKIVDLQ